jgi:hypothetical protein
MKKGNDYINNDQILTSISTTNDDAHIILLYRIIEPMLTVIDNRPTTLTLITHIWNYIDLCNLGNDNIFSQHKFIEKQLNFRGIRANGKYHRTDNVSIFLHDDNFPKMFHQNFENHMG